VISCVPLLTRRGVRGWRRIAGVDVPAWVVYMR